MWHIESKSVEDLHWKIRVLGFSSIDNDNVIENIYVGY